MVYPAVGFGRGLVTASTCTPAEVERQGPEYHGSGSGVYWMTSGPDVLNVGRQMAATTL